MELAEFVFVTCAIGCMIRYIFEGANPVDKAKMEALEREVHILKTYKNIPTVTKKVT